MDVRLWCDRFEQYLRLRNYSLRTVQAYRGEVRALLSFLQEQGLSSLANLSASHLEEYRLHLYYLSPKGKPLTLTTQACRLGAVRHFVRFLVRQDYLLSDVAEHLDLPRRAHTLPRELLSEREMVQLLETPACDTPMAIRDRAMMETLYATGLRNSELIGLQLEEWDAEHHCFRLRLGKGGKSRVVPVGEEAESWLKDYLLTVRPTLLREPGQRTIFLNRVGKPLTRDVLAKTVARWGRLAGLSKGVTPHLLRHCCATHMLKRGADLRYLQILLGHSSINTTERYTQLEVSDLRKVVQRCHPRENLRR